MYARQVACFLLPAPPTAVAQHGITLLSAQIRYCRLKRTCCVSCLRGCYLVLDALIHSFIYSPFYNSRGVRSAPPCWPAASRRARRLTEIEAKRVTMQLLEGLSYLHSKGIVHCDIKPQNLLFAPDPASPEAPTLKPTKSQEKPSSSSSSGAAVVAASTSNKAPDAEAGAGAGAGAGESKGALKKNVGC